MLWILQSLMASLLGGVIYIVGLGSRRESGRGDVAQSNPFLPLAVTNEMRYFQLYGAYVKNRPPGWRSWSR